MPRDFLQDFSESKNIDEPNGRDFLMEKKQPNESFSSSLMQAPLRVAEDVMGGIYNGAKNIPDYYKKAKSEIPGAFNSFSNNPMNAMKQVGAGVAQLGQNAFNTPHDLVNYASQRLNLIPDNVNENVQMGRMPDSSQEINQTFGEAKQPGDELLRGLGRNSLAGLGAKGLANTRVNPLNFRSSAIARDVLNEEKNQVAQHTKRYNKIWQDAEKSGYNEVPINEKKLSDNLSIIEKYKTPKEYQALEDFILEPTLEKAQRAQSDMGVIHRSLEEKSRKGSLLTEEKRVYQAAKDAEKHIEQNMFKNSKGEINDGLQNKYQKLTKSYRENVIPYKYNKYIQDFKNQKLTPKQLVNALSDGEFAVKKGSQHPEIALKNALGPKLKALGIGTAGGASLGLVNYLLDNRNKEIY